MSGPAPYAEPATPADGSRGTADARPDDPAVLLVHPLHERDAELVLSVSVQHRPRLVEMLGSRSLVTRVQEPRFEGGLAQVVVKIGEDADAVGDVVDCLEIMLQLLGRSVFGPLADPSVVDVERSGRDVVADAVESTIGPLRRFLA